MPPFSFGASASPTQQPTGPTPAAGGSNDFLAALMKMLQQPTQQTAPPVDFASIFGAARNDPQGDANKGYIPGTDNQYNPFSNGFFKSADERHQTEQSRGMGGYGPAVGIPPRTDAATNPYAFGAIGQSGPQVTPFSPGPSPGMLQHGGQGMINPALPDATKYQDPNFFTVRPGQSSLPPGMVAGDGKTNYRRKPSGMPGSPQPGFNFQQLFR